MPTTHLTCRVKWQWKFHTKYLHASRRVHHAARPPLWSTLATFHHLCRPHSALGSHPSQPKPSRHGFLRALKESPYGELPLPATIPKPRKPAGPISKPSPIGPLPGKFHGTLATQPLPRARGQGILARLPDTQTRATPLRYREPNPGSCGATFSNACRAAQRALPEAHMGDPCTVLKRVDAVVVSECVVCPVERARKVD